MAGLDMEFSFSNDPNGARVEIKPFNLLLLGDFSGSGGGERTRLTPECPILKVDLDSVDELWTRFRPQLSFRLGSMEIELAPRDIDDFHPDELYRKLPVFQEMRAMRRKLLDPASSRSALEEILASGTVLEETAGDAAQPSAGEPAASKESADDMFERLLGTSASQAPRPAAASGQLDSFIRKLVAPHVVQQTDPRVDTAVDSLDLAATELMRRILHKPAFQALEASWRSLVDTVSQLELDEILGLHVCDISRGELLNALPDPGVSLQDSALFELLVQRRQRAADDDPWTVIVGDYSFGASGEDIALLTGLGAAAAVNGAVFLAGATPGLLGCNSTAELADVHYWSTGDDAHRLWTALRQSPFAPHLGLAMPRVLLRLPYGENGEGIDAFRFEEMSGHSHEDYLWGNPAYHCARLLAEQFTREHWAMSPGSHLDLGELPAYSYVEDGETKLQPCAELLIPESTMTAMFEQGLMPVISYRNRNTAVLGRFQSIASPVTALAGAWAR